MLEQQHTIMYSRLWLVVCPSACASSQCCTHTCRSLCMHLLPCWFLLRVNRLASPAEALFAHFASHLNLSLANQPRLLRIISRYVLELLLASRCIHYNLMMFFTLHNRHVRAKILIALRTCRRLCLHQLPLSVLLRVYRRVYPNHGPHQFGSFAYFYPAIIDADAPPFS
jgi:hypothetical protein